MVKNSPSLNKTGSTDLNTMTTTMDQLPVEQKHSGIVIVAATHLCSTYSSVLLSRLDTPSALKKIQRLWKQFEGLNL